MNRLRPTALIPARILSVLVVLSCAGTALAADEDPVDGIFNYRSYSDSFASSGQPTESQIQGLPKEGFQRVVYIAFSDQERSLPNEDRLVKELGMEYVHIPVDWNAPTPSDFALFAGAMHRSPKKTLLHCQANYRASAFAFLYRTIFENIPVAQAKDDMNDVWVLNQTWTDFVHNTLLAHGIDPNCDGCDWTTKEYE